MQQVVTLGQDFRERSLDQPEQLEAFPFELTIDD